MKLKLSQLKQIIKEEVTRAMNENVPSGRAERRAWGIARTKANHELRPTGNRKLYVGSNKDIEELRRRMEKLTWVIIDLDVGRMEDGRMYMNVAGPVACDDADKIVEDKKLRSITSITIDMERVGDPSRYSFGRVPSIIDPDIAAEIVRVNS